MTRRSLISRLTLGVGVCALLLRAGMPWLAEGAAQQRAVGVAEVCSVYGVGLRFAAARTPDELAPLAAPAVAVLAAPQQADQGSSPHPAHSGDHCALTALAALAPVVAALALAPPARTVGTELALARCAPHPDACALWAARRKQGPPVPV